MSLLSELLEVLPRLQEYAVSTVELRRGEETVSLTIGAGGTGDPEPPKDAPEPNGYDKSLAKMMAWGAQQ